MRCETIVAGRKEGWCFAVGGSFEIPRGLYAGLAALCRKRLQLTPDEAFAENGLKGQSREEASNADDDMA